MTRGCMKIDDIGSAIGGGMNRPMVMRVRRAEIQPLLKGLYVKTGRLLGSEQLLQERVPASGK